jgi:hypothetical protein
MEVIGIFFGLITIGGVVVLLMVAGSAGAPRTSPLVSSFVCRVKSHGI